jgi:hypothetical protein
LESLNLQQLEAITLQSIRSHFLSWFGIEIQSLDELEFVSEEDLE